MRIDSLWQEHQDKLRLFIRSRVSNECDAKDLLHEIFLRAKTRSGSLRDPKKAVSWIYQITRNAVVDYYRSRGKTVELPENFPELKSEKNAWKLISRCARPFIEELPKIYRDALLLSEIEGLDQKQAAQRLGIPLPTAKSRILRGKQKLKKKFEEPRREPVSKQIAHFEQHAPKGEFVIVLPPARLRANG